MYRRVLNEFFGREKIDDKFGSKTRINWLEVRVDEGDGRCSYVAPANYGERGNIKAASAMLAAVFRIQRNMGYLDRRYPGVRITTEETESDEAAAVIKVRPKNNKKIWATYHAVWGAAICADEAYKKSRKRNK